MPTVASLLSHPVPVGTARRPRHPGRVGGAALAAGVLASTALGTSPAAAVSPPATMFVANSGVGNISSAARAGAGSALPEVHVLGRGLNGPDALAVAGGDLFVANGGNENGTSVTELNASTGTLVRVVSATADQIIFPLALAVAGNDLFVLNGGSEAGVGGTLTELNASTGALVRVVSGPPLRFEPSAMAVAGGDLFVVSRLNSSRDWSGQTVTKFNASTAASAWVVPEGKISDPSAVAAAGGDVFVADGYGDSVTELNASTGAGVRVLSGPTYKFKSPSVMAVAGADLFVANNSDEGTASGGPSSAPDSVTELNASTGAVVRLVSGPSYKFDLPHAMAVAGTDLFVANEEGNSVTELDASTGALVRVFSGPSYKFNLPDALAVSGSDLFVANYKGNSVTELPV